MGALVQVPRVPPPAWVSDSGRLRDAVVLVIERERSFYDLSQTDSGGAAWRQAGFAALEAWQGLADSIGVDVSVLLDAADRIVTREAVS